MTIYVQVGASEQYCYSCRRTVSWESPVFPLCKLISAVYPFRLFLIYNSSHHHPPQLLPLLHLLNTQMSRKSTTTTTTIRKEDRKQSGTILMWGGHLQRASSLLKRGFCFPDTFQRHSWNMDILNCREVEILLTIWAGKKRTRVAFKLSDGWSGLFRSESPLRDNDGCFHRWVEVVGVNVSSMKIRMDECSWVKICSDCYTSVRTVVWLPLCHYKHCQSLFKFTEHQQSCFWQNKSQMTQSKVYAEIQQQFPPNNSTKLMAEVVWCTRDRLFHNGYN